MTAFDANETRGVHYLVMEYVEGSSLSQLIKELGPPPVPLAEIVGTLAMAQDGAFGQPADAQLRAASIARRLARRIGLDQAEREAVRWAAPLRYLGCTSHAHDVAVLFGDEIALRARTLVHDAGNLAEVMADVVEFGTAANEAYHAAAAVASPIQPPTLTMFVCAPALPMPSTRNVSASSAKTVSIASNPSRIGFVPATNMIANVVIPISAVVPRSTSNKIRARSALTTANGIANPNSG